MSCLNAARMPTGPIASGRIRDVAVVMQLSTQFQAWTLADSFRAYPQCRPSPQELEVATVPYIAPVKNWLCDAARYRLRVARQLPLSPYSPGVRVG